MSDDAPISCFPIVPTLTETVQRSVQTEDVYHSHTYITLAKISTLYIPIEHWRCDQQTSIKYEPPTEPRCASQEIEGSLFQ